MLHIIWSGKGFLVAVFTFGFSLVANLVTNTVTGSGAYWDAHQWPFAVSLFVSAAACWLVGRSIQNRNVRAARGPEDRGRSCLAGVSYPVLCSDELVVRNTCSGWRDHVGYRVSDLRVTELAQVDKPSRLIILDTVDDAGISQALHFHSAVKPPNLRIVAAAVVIVARVHRHVHDDERENRSVPRCLPYKLRNRRVSLHAKMFWNKTKLSSILTRRRRCCDARSLYSEGRSCQPAQPGNATAMAAKHRFSTAERFGVWHAHKCVCCWCNRPIAFRDTTVDHIIPESYLNNVKRLEDTKTFRSAGPMEQFVRIVSATRFTN